jgi:hypothetical protein
LSLQQGHFEADLRGILIAVPKQIYTGDGLTRGLRDSARENLSGAISWFTFWPAAAPETKKVQRSVDPKQSPRTSELLFFCRRITSLIPKRIPRIPENQHGAVWRS